MKIETEMKTEIQLSEEQRKILQEDMQKSEKHRYILNQENAF